MPILLCFFHVLFSSILNASENELSNASFCVLCVCVCGVYMEKICGTGDVNTGKK